MILATILCSGCTNQISSTKKLSSSSSVPYLPDTELAAPSEVPNFFVSSSQTALRPFYYDWTDAGGGKQEPPAKMHWKILPRKTTILGWIETSQVPIRVIVYRYPWVNATGIPDEKSGSEKRCVLSRVGQEPCGFSKIKHSGKFRIDVFSDDESNNKDCYTVVHAAWLSKQSSQFPSDHGEVSASWAWNRCSP
jgi:hypothetical protein